MLALADELWDVFYEIFGETISREKNTGVPNTQI